MHRISGFIVMAGAARALEESALIQARYLAMADGSVSAAEQAHIDERQKSAERIHALTAADADDPSLIAGSRASYWLDLREYDSPTAAKALTVPMLVLQGERDYEVTMDGDYTRWKAALGSTRTVTWHTYPALDHLFISGRGPSLPAEYFVAGHVDVAVIRDIAAWIERLATAR
jgi:alpha-beta hydrolase superfamily lysophospholipase